MSADGNTCTKNSCASCSECREVANAKAHTSISRIGRLFADEVADFIAQGGLVSWVEALTTSDGRTLKFEIKEILNDRPVVNFRL